MIAQLIEAAAFAEAQQDDRLLVRLWLDKDGVCAEARRDGRLAKFIVSWQSLSQSRVNEAMQAVKIVVERVTV